MLIVDTGVLVAATDRTDPHHDACAQLLTVDIGPLVTTAMVIAETAYLLDRDPGPQVVATSASRSSPASCASTAHDRRLAVRPLS